MSIPKNKIIPKLKKQLKGFLSDESGKVAKEDVLNLALGTMLIVSSITSANATFHGSSTAVSTLHGNGDGANAHGNGGGPATHASFSMTCASSTWWNNGVNGHANLVPAAHSNAWGHGNHTNHGSHGSCGGGCW